MCRSSNCVVHFSNCVMHSFNRVMHDGGLRFLPVFTRMVKGVFLSVFLIFFLSSFFLQSSFLAAQQAVAPPPKVSLKNQQIINRNKLTVSLISDDVASTNLQMASDMAHALGGNGEAEKLRLVPIVGKGGVQNVLDILFLKGIDMGMIQQGQLNYLQKKDPKMFANIKSRIHYISKLYNAEFHVIAPRWVKSIKELKGRKVSFGNRLGSTDVIARIIFEKLGISVLPVNDDLARSLDQLKRGELSAIAILGGVPIQGIKSSELGEDFHILPIDPKSVGLNTYFNLVDQFLPTKITAKHYPGLVPQGQSVPSLASGVLLVVYNWAPKTKRYKKLDVFVAQLFDRFDELLHPSRHPKWREVNLYANIPGMTRFSPADKWLARRREQIGQEFSAGEMKIAMDVFVRQYSKVWKIEQVTPLQRDDIWAAMYRILGRWWVAGLQN